MFRMFRKAVSGITLTLPLISMFALALNAYAGVMPVFILWEKDVPAVLSVDVRVADIGGDGFQDIVVGVGGKSGSSILAFDGWGNLLWNFSNIEENVVTLDVDDIDGDGFDDVVVYAANGWSRGPGGWTNADAYLYVINNSGSLVWKRFLSHGQSGSGQRVFSMGDINGDGKNEIVVDTFREITAFDHLGNKIWSYYLGSTIGNLKVGDVDGDGIMDVVATYWSGLYSGGIITFNGAGDILWKYTTGAGMKALAIGDVNEDGRNEIAASNYWSAEDARNGIYLLDSSGTLLWYSQSASYANSIKIGDVNDDGVGDIVAGTENGDVYVINTHGNTLWSYNVEATPISEIALGDFDGDGRKNDVAICGAHYSLNPERSDGVWTLNSSGSMIWEFRGENNFVSLSVGDINADGIDDIITSSLDLEGFGGKIYALSSKFPAPPTPAVNATVDVHPETLNLWSRGRWITAYIELPEGYDVADINVSSIMLNETVPVYLKDVPAPKPVPTAIGNYDGDGVPDLMVKFDRAEVISYILANVNLTKPFEERFMTVTLTITGYLNDGTPFQGSTTIRITMPTPRFRGFLKIFPI